MRNLFGVFVLMVAFFVSGCMATMRTKNIAMEECKIPPSVTECHLVYYHNYETKQERYNGVVKSKVTCKMMRKLMKGRHCTGEYKIYTKPETRDNHNSHNNI
ncbi:hypothetical protein L6259_03710 [Candidatus Parcubacteria bacterium]|nr:hypothetical protein [Patescibacteria group bacterium]MCG2694342.1 hypothetical protein [Candidatus Parcubacteria bacterium]